MVLATPAHINFEAGRYGSVSKFKADSFALIRLRCENELGFKMVKWIVAIEFVSDFADLGACQGGYNEDHEFYGYRMSI